MSPNKRINGTNKGFETLGTPRDRILEQFPIHPVVELMKEIPCEKASFHESDEVNNRGSEAFRNRSEAFWHQQEADLLVRDLKIEIERIRVVVFQGTFPCTVENVLTDWIEIAQDYRDRPWGRIRRGWDPLSVLRRMKQTVRQNVENWFACQKITRTFDWSKGEAS